MRDRREVPHKAARPASVFPLGWRTPLGSPNRTQPSTLYGARRLCWWQKRGWAKRVLGNLLLWTKPVICCSRSFSRVFSLLSHTQPYPAITHSTPLSLDPPSKAPSSGREHTGPCRPAATGWWHNSRTPKGRCALLKPALLHRSRLLHLLLNIQQRKTPESTSSAWEDSEGTQRVAEILGLFLILP